MKCKLSEKCEFGNLCKDATRHDSLTVLGCSSFKTKKPMTNEEWFASLSTKEKAEWLQEHMDCIGCPASQEKCHRYYDACKEVMMEWLKQPHTPKE